VECDGGNDGKSTGDDELQESVSANVFWAVCALEIREGDERFGD
jgi:hypothetical protein